MLVWTLIAATVVATNSLRFAVAVPALHGASGTQRSQHMHESSDGWNQPGSHGRELFSAATAPSETGLRAEPVELTASNFDDTIATVPESTLVLLELYASWCPHCRAFKPTYDKIGAFFNGIPPPPGPHVWVARVDCADMDNNARVCNTFKIKGYPTIVFGPVPDIKNRHPEIVTPRDISGILTWISKKTHTEYEFNEASLKAVEAAPLFSPPTVFVPPVSSYSWTADMEDIKTATIQGFGYIVNSSTLLQEDGAQAALKRWAQLLAMTHPVPKCMKGSEMLATHFDQVWPGNAVTPSPTLKKFHVCGREAQIQDWHGCQGSQPNTRGYTCGLWQLLHTTTANLPEDGGQFWVEAVKGYISHFFQCALCAHHFTIRISKSDAADVMTRKDAVLWIWRVHNEVNLRLAREEAKHNTGDPQFPKREWPPESLCADCRITASGQNEPIIWDEERVVAFILRYYGSHAQRPPGSSVKEELTRLAATTTNYKDGSGEDPPHENFPVHPTLRRTGSVVGAGGTVRLAGQPAYNSSADTVAHMNHYLRMAAGVFLAVSALVAARRLRSFYRPPRSAATTQ